MRVLIVSTDYGPFLRELYGASDGLARAPFSEQMRRRNESLFGVAHSYARAFAELGHEAQELHANNAPLQLAWLTANGITLDARSTRSNWTRLAWRVAGRVSSRFRPYESPLRSPVEPSEVDLDRILIAQIRAIRPDVILNQAVSEVGSRVLRRVRDAARLIVGQIASPLPEGEDYDAYDLMVSSLPNFVSHFRAMGLPSHLNGLAFDPEVLNAVTPAHRDIPVSFVGSITGDHVRRYDLLQRLVTETDIAIWGRVTSVAQPSVVWQRYRGQAWGREMYRILARSRITINQHIDIAGPYANNLRLFEATGSGALLITDWKQNVDELFEPGKEVVCYRDADECIALIKYYAEHDAEREAIASAGQRRTLTAHTYRHRVAELATLFADRLSSRR